MSMDANKFKPLFSRRHMSGRLPQEEPLDLSTCNQARSGPPQRKIIYSEKTKKFYSLEIREMGPCGKHNTLPETYYKVEILDEVGAKEEEKS